MLSISQRLIGSLTQTCSRLSYRASSSVAGVKDVEKERPDDLYRELWLRCQSHDSAVLDSYEIFLRTSARHLDIEYVKTEAPWRLIQKRTLLSSRFVHKKNRTQYEFRTYYRHLLFKNLTGSTLDTFLEYVERQLPEGILMITEKHKIDTLPFDLQNETTEDNASVTRHSNDDQPEKIDGHSAR